MPAGLPEPLNMRLSDCKHIDGRHSYISILLTLLSVFAVLMYERLLALFCFQIS